jgi:hypothetical protein
MDEVSLYNRALSASEILAIYYNAGSAGKCPPPPLFPPSCTPAPTNLVSWWRAETNANDSVSGNNGIAQYITYNAGEVGQAFVFNGSSTSIRVPASSTLNVGLGGGLTTEVWINPLDFSFQSICEWNQNGSYNSGFSGGQIGAHLELNEYNADGSLWGNLIDTSGNAHVINTAGGVITTNVWQHVAMTYDKSSGVAVLYRNGVAAAMANLGTFTPQTSSDFFMGRRPAGPFAGLYFNGKMDEVSLYNRALSASEILAIYYNAGSAGKCPPPPTSSVSVLTVVTLRPTLSGGTLTSSSFSFNINGVPNTYWNVFSSSDLTNWTLVGGVTLNGSGSYLYIGGDISTVSQRFYKLSNGDCCSQTIGFERLTAGQGLTAIADPLAAPVNTLDGLFKPAMPNGTSLPDGTEILKWNGSVNDYDYYTWETGQWTPDGNATLSPDEGAFIENNSGSSFTVTFVGLINEGQTAISLPGGSYNFISSTVLQAGGLQTALGYIPNAGDQVLRWNYANQGWACYTYTKRGHGSTTTQAWSPSEPVISVGESFFIEPKTNNVWTENYPVCQ